MGQHGDAFPLCLCARTCLQCDRGMAPKLQATTWWQCWRTCLHVQEERRGAKNAKMIVDEPVRPDRLRRRISVQIVSDPIAGQIVASKDGLASRRWKRARRSSPTQTTFTRRLRRSSRCVMQDDDNNDDNITSSAGFCTARGGRCTWRHV